MNSMEVAKVLTDSGFIVLIRTQGKVVGRQRVKKGTGAIAKVTFGPDKGAVIILGKGKSKTFSFSNERELTSAIAPPKAPAKKKTPPAKKPAEKKAPAKKAEPKKPVVKKTPAKGKPSTKSK